MPQPHRFVRPLACLIPLTLTLGCVTVPRGDRAIPPDVPVELNKVTHPEYVIEAPDILQITAIQLLPRQPYQVQALDTLSVSVLNIQPNEPISGLFIIDPEGMLNLGPQYKSIRVVGMKQDEIQKAIELSLMEYGFKKPQVSVSVAQIRGVQQIAGEHLVRADGTVYLGTYGSVRVTGLTLTEARIKIEQQLAATIQDPKITLDVLAYNSKVLYVIFDGAGAGQQVYRLPITGNETVLDAISKVNGLGFVSDKQHIWVARPAPPGGGCDQVLPVDWVGVTTKGQTATNYQLLPGDRVFVKAYAATTLDYTMARAFAPIERLLGITLLGSSTYQSLTNSNNNNNRNNP